MKKRVGLWKYLLSGTLLLVLFATNALAVDVSGTVSYSGSKNGRIFVTVDTNIGRFGTSIASPGVYTIRGVPASASYTVKSFMDDKALGEQVQSSPSGSTVSTTGAANVSLSDSTAVTPAAPTRLEAYPGDSSVIIGWDGEKNASGLETADAYVVYWNTTPVVTGSSALGSKLVPARSDSPAIIGGLTNGAGYYFVVVPVYGGVNGAPSTVLGPVTVGPTTGLNTITGTVNYSGPTATGPLYVLVVTPKDKGLGSAYFTKIINPSTAQAFFVSGVPNGLYEVYAIYDMNNDGVFKSDVGNTDDSAPSVTLAGSGVGGLTISLVGGNAGVSVDTDHRKQNGGTGDWYHLHFNVKSKLKRAVAVTLTSAPASSGLTVPMDLAIKNDEVEFWGSPTTRPVVGDLYGLELLYSDGTVESFSASISGVLDSFPVNPMVSSPVSTVPTFVWQAPVTPPAAPYKYSVWVGLQGNNYWEAWALPSSQLTAVYGADATPLQTGTIYGWNVSTRDQNGNSATIQGNFTPTVAGSVTPPVVSTGSASGTYTYNSGSGVLALNWTNSNFACSGPTVGAETATVTVLTGTSMVGIWGDPATSTDIKTFTRSSGTSGSILGTWTIVTTSGLSGINFNLDGTITMSGTENCSTPPVSPTAFIFTSAVQDCSGAACVNLPGVTITSVGLTPEITTTSDASGIFTLTVPVTTLINNGSQSATAPFHLVLSKSSFANAASTQMQLTVPVDVRDRPYALYTSANLSGWGNNTGTGVIKSRVVDAANPVSGYIAGATVTASTATGGSLPVDYIDPATGNVVSTGTTRTNGVYIVRNVPAGSVVTVTVTAPNFTNFQPRTFVVYADTVSEGRLAGVSNSTSGGTWTVYNANPTNKNDIDWLQTSHSLLSPGSYIKINGTYYYTSPAGGISYWNNPALYWGNGFYSCNQTTGALLYDTATPPMPVRPDLSGTAGMTIEFFAAWPGGATPPTAALPTGDINGDNTTDIADALKVLEIAVGRVTATTADIHNADVAPLVNGKPAPDGTIGIGDVVVLLRRIVGLETW